MHDNIMQYITITTRYDYIYIYTLFQNNSKIRAKKRNVCNLHKKYFVWLNQLKLPFINYSLRHTKTNIIF